MLIAHFAAALLSQSPEATPEVTVVAPVNSSERERMASDMLKDMQRLGRIEGD